MNLADRMRLNLEIYRSKFDKKQKDYIKTLFKEIEIASKEGGCSIKTLHLHSNNDWFTYDFYKSIPSIFEKEGFEVKEDRSNYGLLTSWWVISW